jgi:Fe-S-cluster containining protein
VDFTYPTEISFSCNGCGLCCGDTPKKTRHILLLPCEKEKIAEETGMPANQFSNEIKDKQPYCFEIKKTNLGKCIFLKNNQCTIYSLRPLICRFYPFQLTYDLDKEKHVFDFTLECPAINQGKPFGKKEFEKLFELARKILP